MKHIKELKDLFNDIYKNTGELNNANDYLNYNSMDIDTVDFDTIVDELTDKNFFAVDILYYKIAMEYLMENDPSLKESLEIAEEFGYSAGNLSSEMLASIHASAHFESDFRENEEEINELINKLKEEQNEK